MTAQKHAPAQPPRLIAMVHAGALPGTPVARDPIATLAHRAAEEAALLTRAGFDAVIVENMHDAPYLMRTVGPEITAAMTAIAGAVRAAIPPSARLGIQILGAANAASLAVALASRADFIRAEGFAFAAIADEGLLAEADAGPLLRFRRAIAADHIAIYADIKKKHSSHSITADISIAEAAAAAHFFRADAIIITGSATAKPAADTDIREAKSASPLPVLVGSGVTASTARATLGLADAIIVGSDLKRNGHWANPLDPDRIKRFLEAARG